MVSSLLSEGESSSQSLIICVAPSFWPALIVTADCLKVLISALAISSFASDAWGTLLLATVELVAIGSGSDDFFGFINFYDF